MRNYTIVPQDVKNYIGQHSEQLKDMSMLVDKKTKTLDKLRYALNTYKAMRTGYSTVSKFVR